MASLLSLKRAQDLPVTAVHGTTRLKEVQIWEELLNDDYNLFSRIELSTVSSWVRKICQHAEDIYTTSQLGHHMNEDQTFIRGSMTEGQARSFKDSCYLIGRTISESKEKSERSKKDLQAAALKHSKRKALVVEAAVLPGKKASTSRRYVILTCLALPCLALAVFVFNYFS
jgi:hypothetical protein